MYYFRFTKQQQKVLMEILKSDEITFKFSFSSNYFILENQLDIQNCFDYILDYFICNGLLKNDEPSRFGVEIENINQIINHQLVLNNSKNDFSKKQPTKYLQARALYFNCKGNIDNLDNENKKKYKKLNIPSWLEENWSIYINNKEIERKLKNN